MATIKVTFGVDSIMAGLRCTVRPAMTVRSASKGIATKGKQRDESSSSSVKPSRC